MGGRTVFVMQKIEIHKCRFAIAMSAELGNTMQCGFFLSRQVSLLSFLKQKKSLSTPCNAQSCFQSKSHCFNSQSTRKALPRRHTCTWWLCVHFCKPCPCDVLYIPCYCFGRELSPFIQNFTKNKCRFVIVLSASQATTSNAIHVGRAFQKYSYHHSGIFGPPFSYKPCEACRMFDMVDANFTSCSLFCVDVDHTWGRICNWSAWGSRCSFVCDGDSFCLAIFHWPFFLQCAVAHRDM